MWSWRARVMARPAVTTPPGANHCRHLKPQQPKALPNAPQETTHPVQTNPVATLGLVGNWALSVASHPMVSLLPGSMPNPGAFGGKGRQPVIIAPSPLCKPRASGATPAVNPGRRRPWEASCGLERKAKRDLHGWLAIGQRRRRFQSADQLHRLRKAPPSFTMGLGQFLRLSHARPGRW